LRWRSGTGGSESGRHVRDAVRFTRIDAFRTVTSVCMIILGAVILVRTFPLGVHLQALLVGGAFIGLGAYRLTFVVGYVLRHRRPA
jgi:hypothetical protein